jgi:V/A-type H+-transporting ATPase subunit C
MDSWGFITGRLRSLENYFLPYTTLIRWSESPNIETFMKYVKDSVYGEVFTEGNLYKYETVLEDNVQALYDELMKIIPQDSLIRIHRLSSDQNNIKMIYKAKMSGREVNWEILSENGFYSPEDLFPIIEEKLYSKLHPALDKAMRNMDEEFKKTGNIQTAEFILDRAFNDLRLDLLEGPDYKNIADYYRTWIDLENIKNLLRAKRLDIDRAYVPHILLDHGTIDRFFFENLYFSQIGEIAEELIRGRYGEPLADGIRTVLEKRLYSQLEKSIDELLLAKVGTFRYAATGPEVVEGFIQRKMMEIKNLKIVFIGVLNGMDPDEIKGRVRNAGLS